MALQGSGAISITQIRSELGESSYSLRSLSASATPAKGTPDAMSEFYGYSDFYTINMILLAGGGGGGRGASFQGGGGGGAGGCLKAYGYSVRKGTTISVTIGGGGTGGANSSPGHGTNGGNTTVQGSFGTLTSYGGGYGGGYTLTGGSGGAGGGGGRDACSNYQAPATMGTIDNVGGYAGGRAYFCGCGSASGGGGIYSAGKDAQFDCGNGWDSNLIKGGIAWVPGGNSGVADCQTDIGGSQWCGVGGSGAGEVNGGPIIAEWHSNNGYSRGGSYQYCSTSGLGGAGDGGGGSRGSCGENGGNGGYGNVWIFYSGGQRGQGGYAITYDDSINTNHVFRYSGTYTVNS